MSLAWWQGEGGDAYLARNRVNWALRVPFWKAIVRDLQPKSVLEVGCNAGWNLLALREANPKIILSGIEPNDKAREEAARNGLAVCQSWPEAQYLGFDLVFTSGVLIHVPPVILTETMLRIAEASKRYVIAIEYEAETETEIEYRGEMGLLWKRPYGKLYEAMGLKTLGSAFLPPESGFDRCQYNLLEKVSADVEEEVYGAA